MSLQTVQLEPKQPWEIVSYVFNLSKSVPSTEVFSSVAFVCYNDADNPASFTDLSSAMIAAVSYDTSARTVTAQTQAGTDGETYILRYRLQCSSGDRYEGEGRFKVTERG
jgi:hypothetical protein